MQFTDMFFIVVYVLVAIIGIVGNLVLLVVATKKSPPSMKIYSVLLIFHSFSNFLSCFASILTIPRLIHCGSGFAIVYNGPCSLFGSYFCHQSYTLLLQTHSTFLYFVAASFIYRYYVLIRPTPRYSTVVTCSILICVISLIQFTTVLLTYEDSKRIVDSIELAHPSYNFSKESVFGGTTNMLSGSWIFAGIIICLSVVCVCVASIYCRMKILATLEANVRLSDCSRTIHRRLLQVLTLQAILPVFIIIGIVNYLCILFTESDILEHSVMLWTTLVPSISPFLTLLFIQPYEKVIRQIFRRHVFVARETNPVNCGHYTDRSNKY